MHHRSHPAQLLDHTDEPGYDLFNASSDVFAALRAVSDSGPWDVVRLDSDPDSDRAYLSLVPGGTIAQRLDLADTASGEELGISLDFGASGHLVGIGFEDAEQRVPPGLLARGEGLSVNLNPGIGAAAYLHHRAPIKGSVAETLTFGEDVTGEAWTVSLDLDRDGYVVGVEFESSDTVPPSVLQLERVG